MMSDDKDREDMASNGVFCDDMVHDGMVPDRRGTSNRIYGTVGPLTKGGLLLAWAIYIYIHIYKHKMLQHSLKHISYKYLSLEM